MIDLVQSCSSNGIFLLNAWKWYFFIEREEIHLERYFFKILFHSFEWDGIIQKLNLAHAWFKSNLFSSYLLNGTNRLQSLSLGSLSSIFSFWCIMHGAYQSEALERSVLICKYKNRLKWHVGNKHSSLFHPFTKHRERVL